MVIVVVLFFLLFCLAKLKVLVIINERKKIVHVYISSVGLVVFPSSLLTLPCKKLIKNCKKPLRIYISMAANGNITVNMSTTTTTKTELML